MTCDKLIHRERIKKEARAIAAADPSTTSVTLRTMAWNVLTGQPPLVRCRGRHEMAANDVECPDCEGEGSVDYTCGTCVMTSELKEIAERLVEIAQQCVELERANEDLKWRLETREREIRYLKVDVINLNMEGM